MPCGSEEKVEYQKRKSSTPIESRSIQQCFQSPLDENIPPNFTVSTSAVATDAPSHSPMASSSPSDLHTACIPSHSPLAADVQYHTPMDAGALSCTSMAAGAPSHITHGY